MLSTDTSESPFVRTGVKIPSITPGWDLDAWKYVPRRHGNTKPSQGWPIIIMAHGLTGNKLMGLAPYAETFASLGYASVVFDYRRWGASAGTPRHVLYVSEQLDDYRTVVKYCRQQPDLDPHKVILWGTSFSGGHVTTLASEKELNLSAVIAQCPYLGTSPPTKLSRTTIKVLWKCLQDVLRQTFGMSPKYIPAVAHPGEVACMALPGAKDGMFAMVKDERDYPNEVSASSLLELPFYNPNASGARITCPILVIALQHDNVCMMKAATELQALSPRVELVAIPAGHFDVYPGRPHYEKALDAMIAFLAKHVPTT